MDSNKEKAMQSTASVSIRGTAGGAASVTISLDGRKPILKIKVKGKVVGAVELDSIISESLENNALNKKFLKLWRDKFKQSSIMLDDFLSCLNEDMNIED